MLKSIHSRALLRMSAGLLLLMMSLWIAVQLWGNPWYKNIRAEFTTAPYARTITVDGVGKITVKPDIAMVSLSVAAAGKTVKEVTEGGNKKMNAIVDELKKLGVKPEDMQTSQYNLYPQYDYDRPVIYGAEKVGVNAEGVAKIIGYNLTQTVDVKIRDLAKSDEVLDRAIAAGANQVGALSFDLDDASMVKKDARREAFAKAHEKAQEMAAAAGVKLGRVVTFSESGGGFPMPYANFAMKALDSVEAGIAPAIEAGSKELGVNVSVTYEID